MQGAACAATLSAQAHLLTLSARIPPAQVGFAGEAAPRHIVHRHTLHGARDGSLTHEERVELVLRDIFTRLLMCTARRRHILVCESLVEPTKSREALVKVRASWTGTGAVCAMKPGTCAAYSATTSAPRPRERPGRAPRAVLTCAQTPRGQVLVQRLGAASVCLLPSPQLALYGSGLDGDGLVVLVGHGETSVLPVSCNVPLVHSAGVATLGTRDLLLCLHSLSLEVKAGTPCLPQPRCAQRQAACASCWLRACVSGAGVL